MHSSWRKADHYPTEMLFFLRLGGLRPQMVQQAAEKLVSHRQETGEKDEINAGSSSFAFLINSDLRFLFASVPLWPDFAFFSNLLEIGDLDREISVYFGKGFSVSATR